MGSSLWSGYPHYLMALIYLMPPQDRSLTDSLLISLKYFKINIGYIGKVLEAALLTLSNVVAQA